MNTATRLATYGAGLALVFGGAFGAADTLVPASTVSKWTTEAKGHNMNGAANGHGGHDASGSTGAGETVPGVTNAQGDYLLTPVAAPRELGQTGMLTFRILQASGKAVMRFATSHEKQLHLIVVRTDGTQFRHVHPTLNIDGTWSLPWQWAAAGTYRVYADFVPETDGAAEPITLTRTVEVAGQFTPTAPAPTNTATVDGYRVNLTGDLNAASSSKLTFAVSKGGVPVKNLEPYLGAFGHLVALRDGDLAFLHVHPEGDEPSAGETSGPDVGFVAHVPTAGSYLLYLDFQVDGKVHSAPFVVNTTGTAADKVNHSESTHSDNRTDSGTDAGHDAGHDH